MTITKAILTEEDLRSAVWLKLRTHYEAQLNSLREKNDSPTLNAEDTARLRGRIAEIRGLLRLGDPPLIVPH